jgi:hypothetical protein
MYAAFGHERLDPCNDKVKGTQLKIWKESIKTIWCRSNLWTQINPDGTTFMDLIIRGAFPDEEQQTDSNIAFAFAIVDALLDPNVTDTRLYESTLFPRLDSDYISKAKNKALASKNEILQEIYFSLGCLFLCFYTNMINILN